MPNEPLQTLHVLLISAVEEIGFNLDRYFEKNIFNLIYNN